MFSCFQRVIGLVTGGTDEPTDRLLHVLSDCGPCCGCDAVFRLILELAWFRVVLISPVRPSGNASRAKQDTTIPDDKGGDGNDAPWEWSDSVDATPSTKSASMSKTETHTVNEPGHPTLGAVFCAV